LEGDDPFATGGGSRDLDRVLDGLRAAVREHALRRDRLALGVRKDPIELLSEADVRLVRDDLRRHVRVSIELFPNGGKDLGMLVPEVQGTDARDEIEVAP